MAILCGETVVPGAEERKFDVLVIGAMKAATSTVCAYLEDNPDIYMVPRAEPNYFSHDANFSKGADWYATYLEATPPNGSVVKAPTTTPPAISTPKRGADRGLQPAGKDHLHGAASGGPDHLRLDPEPVRLWR